EYFVMGDNRNNSLDSRNEMVGNIHRSEIIGRAWIRIWPFSKFGILQHQ
ncbi:MAG: signal peptidase I, partial [Acetatifactor sp.]|nr:signal peptidase I [Acetatifactor sp.]